MITANSRTAHRVDTALHGGMTNLSDPQRAGRISEQEFEELLRRRWAAPSIVPTQRTWPVRLWRAITRPIRRRFLAWRERCVREEREGYEAQQIPMGPTYRRNCLEQERDYRSRQAMLDLE